MRRRIVIFLFLSALIMAGLIGAGSGTANAAATPSLVSTEPVLPNVNAVPGLTFVSQTQLDPRLYQLTFFSTALNADTNVRVLLPDGYEEAATRYPVLYLFHGGSGGSYSDWTTLGNAEPATAGLPMIVVMPDSGPDGLCGNWYNNGAFGTPEWATYHINQLIPWIDANYQTIPNRTARATAGLSSGGQCAVSYAAQYPDLFGATAAFSGMLDDNNAIQQAILSPVAGSVAGSYLFQQVRWRGFNSSDLAANLVNTNVSLFCGNGLPGGPTGNAFDFGEWYYHQESVSMDQRLTQLNIPHYFDDYGPGVHAWYFWQRDLVQWLPSLMAYFGKSTSAPTSFTYTSINPSYSQYGWSVSVQRPALEFSALQVNGPGSFSVVGSGSASVVTAPDFTPGQTYVITTTGSATGPGIQFLTANSAGQLTVTVRLGPGNPFQQYTLPGWFPPPGAVTDAPFYEGNGSFFFRTTVSVLGVG